MSIQFALYFNRLVVLLLVVNNVRVNCFPDGETSKVKFLNKELEIPKSVKSELIFKVREITKDYESQAAEIGKDFDVCKGPESNSAKCLAVFKRIGEVYEKLSAEFNNLEEYTRSQKLDRSFLSGALDFVKDVGKDVLKSLSEFVFDKIMDW